MAKESTLGGLLLGLVIGIVTTIPWASWVPSQKDDIARIIKQENQPNVIRTHESRGPDHIYVQDLENPNDPYRSFKQHLNSIEGEYNKDMEDARIRKQVGW